MQTLRRRRKGQELGKDCKFCLDLRTIVPTATVNADEKSQAPALASDTPGSGDTLNAISEVLVALNKPESPRH